MYKRKIYSEMLEWKESLSVKKKALIIKGLRQTGKTTSAKEFCEENYKHVVYINFMDNKTIKKVFDNDLDVDTMIRDLSAALPEARFVEKETVIIFDELQECANARASIKAFMIDGRFDIVATGSLIGLRGYNKKRSKGVPTGFEKTITMYPMDFEEFLWAKGIDESVIDYAKDCFIKNEIVSDVTNQALFDYFGEYICVGGMPDVVRTFLTTHDMNQVREVQRDLLENFQDDFGKHLDEEENEVINHKLLVKIMNVYHSIPSQLAKENKKFQYRKISDNAKGREYRSAITWLEEFGLIRCCYNLEMLELPLEGNKIENQFKVYVADTGLFVAMLEEGTAFNILNGDLQVYKGAIYENIVADAFIKNGKALYYYSNNSLELDFVTRYENALTVVEARGTNGNAKALSTMQEGRVPRLTYWIRRGCTEGVPCG